jgi:hypothetical protein
MEKYDCGTLIMSIFILHISFNFEDGIIIERAYFKTEKDARLVGRFLFRKKRMNFLSPEDCYDYEKSLKDEFGDKYDILSLRYDKYLDGQPGTLLERKIEDDL